MSKKKLDVFSMTNELRGQSVFFPRGCTKRPGERAEEAKSEVEKDGIRGVMQ